MKQYNRIMLGEHGKFLSECLSGNYIGINFSVNTDLSEFSDLDESAWRKLMMEKYLTSHPDKSSNSARNSAGFMWTVCRGLKNGDIILASTGEGAYRVGEITGDYFYSPNSNLPHRRIVKWLDIIINRKDMSKQLQNSTGSIGTCCNITKYASEIGALISGNAQPTPTKDIKKTTQENYKERSLHKLLANILTSEGIISKTIYHESSKADRNKKWVHPDMVGVKFNEFQDNATRSLLKAADTKQYIDIYSYELKRRIENDHELKECFFQALSNSNWANYGYLVAFEISDDLIDEMERLNRAFGIGIIRLSPFENTTQILFQARKNDIDYFTVDKLCKLNHNFRDFMIRVSRILNAQPEVIEDVKHGLISFCDTGFQNEDEIISYCLEHQIPITN